MRAKVFMREKVFNWVFGGLSVVVGGYYLYGTYMGVPAIVGIHNLLLFWFIICSWHWYITDSK